MGVSTTYPTSLDLDPIKEMEDRWVLRALVAVNAIKTKLGIDSSADTNSIDYKLSQKQPLDATLTAFAALTIAANSLTIGTGADAFTQTTFAANTFPARASTGNLVAKTVSDFIFTVLDDADGPTVRTTIGAGTSSFSGVFADLTGKPTTLSGYGITDGATRSYVDLAVGNLVDKMDCQAATTAVLAAYTYANGSSGVGATITLTVAAVLVLDGYTPALNDRILVKNETAGNRPYNGIYKLTTLGVLGVTQAVLTRTLDFDQSEDGLDGAHVFVQNGTVNANTEWYCSTNAAITFGTTNISFSQFTGTTYTADETSLHLSGTTFSILSTWTGQTAITTLGTIGTGTWQGTVVGSTYGGTGVNNAGRTLTIAANSGTVSFSAASLTLTVAAAASVSGTNTGDQTITLTGDVTGSGTGSFAATIATAQPNVHTWASVQTFTLAPVFSDQAGTRTALGLGTLATQSGTFSGTSSGINTGDQTTVSGNAGTATKLQTARNINGVSFDGTADITVTASGSTLTGSTLAAGLIGTAGTQACAGNDSRLSDARAPSAHASTHLGGSDPTTLVNYIVRELIVEDEPLVLDSGIVLVVGSDNTALVWCDSGAQDVRSPVTFIQFQVVVKDEPFIVMPNELCVVGDASGRSSIWCDSGQLWDRVGERFSTVTELNADNLFAIAAGDVWEVPANSPLIRHRDATLVDSAVLWIQ